MNYEEYQSLSADEKMLARIRSLDNVVRASNIVLVADEQVLENDKPTNPRKFKVATRAFEGKIISAEVSKMVVAGFKRPLLQPLSRSPVLRKYTPYTGFHKTAKFATVYEVHNPREKTSTRIVKNKPAAKK